MSEAPREFCYRCHKALGACVCASLPRVPNRTPVHVIQHPREARCAIGTVRLVRLGLERCTVEVNAPWSGAPSRLAAAPPPGAAVLYPSEGARPLETLPLTELPRALIVLDGTWHQARTLHRSNPWLDALPHVVLADPTPSAYRIRAEPRRHYLSTVEAIVAALSLIEPDTPGLTTLLCSFGAMVDYQIDRARQRAVRRARAVTRARPPVALGDVVVHAETAGPPDARRIVHLCAVRVATGERFEAVGCPARTADTKLAHLGLSEAHRAAAIPEELLRQRWRAFLRPGEQLCAWSSRTLQALGAQPDAVLLKAAWCNATRAPAGDLVALVAARGLPTPPPLFAGRTGALLGCALAVRAALLGDASPP
ncbi:MAG: hypothetical protein AMXMBFR64_02490 [Myxococcales bacterium]